MTPELVFLRQLVHHSVLVLHERVVELALSHPVQIEEDDPGVEALEPPGVTHVGPGIQLPVKSQHVVVMGSQVVAHAD